MQWEKYWTFCLATLVLISHNTIATSTLNFPQSMAPAPLKPVFEGTAPGGIPLLSSSASAWNEQKISNRISQTLEESFIPLTEVAELSGDGSGMHDGHNKLHLKTGASVSLLEENMLTQELQDKRNWGDSWFHQAPPSPQRQIQLMDSDGSSEINDIQVPETVRFTTPKQAMQTQSLRSTIATVIPIKLSISKRESTTQVITPSQRGSVNMNPGKELESEMKSHTPKETEKTNVKAPPEDITVKPTGQVDHAYSPNFPKGFMNVTTKLQMLQLLKSTEHMATQMKPNETDYVTNNTTKADSNEDFLAKHSEQDELMQVNPVRIDASTGQDAQTAFPVLSAPCRLGLGLCVAPPESNGTALQWEDLRRTLAFAWELHVFGCAILFLLLVLGATFGLSRAVGLLRPYSIVLPMANVCLLLAGLLRCVHFSIDPYGTRHILPRPVFSALFNLPLPLLLWAQAVLALVVLRGQRLNFLPPALDCPRVTGGLVVLHCSLLLLADMLSLTLSPALPLMLQTFSVCWGLPLCIGLLFQTLNPPLSARTPIPHWFAAKRIEDRARRVFCLCTILGTLSCALQIHGILWLYGLLGDWRRFGWGWWLGQFSARLLELAWGYSMLLLASWVFWRPRPSSARAEARGEAKQKGRLGACWDSVLVRLHQGAGRKADKHWADLIPNNWAAQQRSHGDTRSPVIHNKDVAIATHQGPKNSNLHNVGTASTNIISEQHPTPVWSSDHNWSERDCILSLIEFDLCPPSPISLSRSIDLALHHHDDLLGVGSLFSPQPPSWTQGLEPYCPSTGSATAPPTPTHIAYRWALDAGSSPVRPQCFRGSVHHSQSVQSDAQSPLSAENLKLHLDETEPGCQRILITEDDWSSVGSTDDITDL